MWYSLIALEVISLFLSMTAWSQKYIAGGYKKTLYGYLGHGEYGNYIADQPGAPFVGYLIMGLIPLFAASFFTGKYLHNRELNAKIKRDQLEAEQKHIDKLLEAHQ